MLFNVFTKANPMRFWNLRHLRPHLLAPAVLFGLAAGGSFAQSTHTGGMNAHRHGRAPVKHTGVTQTGTSAGRTLTITASDQNRTYLCTHSNIEVNGSQNRLTLKGTCDSVRVTGSGNRLRVIGTVADVSMTGSGNVVTWTKQTSQGTHTSDTGPNNSAGYKP